MNKRKIIRVILAEETSARILLKMEVICMASYILRRLIFFIPTILVISILAFLVIEAPPGDFATAQIESLISQFGDVRQSRIDLIRRIYGLDKPLYVRYYSWLKGIVLRGDFGYSFAQNRPVTEIIIARLPLTILMTSCTMLFAWLIAIPIGVYSAVKQYSFFDYIFTFFAFVGRSIPNFLLALILMFFVYKTFNWSVLGLFSERYSTAPWSIWKLLDLIKHLVVPIIVIGTAGTAGMVRILRGMVLDELNKEYVQTARAKGLSEKVVIWKHIFRIAVLPIISTVGWLLPALFSGAVITSIVLNLPTIGASLMNALLQQDMYVAGSFILILGTLTVLGTLISDILLAFLDPQIRYN